MSPSVHTSMPSMQDFYFSALAKRVPIIIRLGDFSTIGWRTDKWSADYLAQRAGSQTVKVMHRINPDLPHSPENSEYLDCTFREFLDESLRSPQGSDEWYLNLQGYRVMDPPLLQLIGDFSIPDLYRELPLRSINVWMGKSRKKILTPLHHDFNDNLYAIVKGKKCVTLFPPECARAMYTRGEVLQIQPNGMIDYHDMKNQYMPHMAQVDIDQPDYIAHPEYKHAESRRLNVTLHAGDMLYIPCGWFHQVSSLAGEHIALSFFAEPPTQQNLEVIRQHEAMLTGADP